MTLEKNLRKSLSESSALLGLHLVRAHEGPWEVTLGVHDRDRLGMLLESVCCTRRPGVDTPLEDQAKTLVSRVLSLGEVLRVYEVDASKQTALLRSEKPTPDNDGVSYFEILLHADGWLRLHRYRGYHEVGQPRVMSFFALTDDQIVRLVSELTQES